MTSAPSNRRRTYIVDKSLQLRFTGLIVLLSLIYFAGFAYVAVVVEKVVSRTFAEIVERCHPGAADLAGRFRQLDRGVMVETLGIMALLVVILALFGILLTHKIAGPIYRVQKVVEAIRDGRPLGPIFLRKGDELTGLAGKVNEMIACLEQARKKDIEAWQRVKTKVRDLAEKPADAAHRASLLAIVSEIDGVIREKEPPSGTNAG